ncbi:hypothetical protein C1N91_02525 [Curtobacterium sp. SGAir0471]|uniref:hypothetical protein n=1 Tax=Curtobacterium sp. SGAir0471 TaxID=2070337 RepID=UPI0010CCF500|nr:hypothetical protein [Curtobacterium sp. SGAir0471]QCR42589.1 hypothetical protein C1N91_02525 [Curtobacterium sp. SGAir0471]
MRLLTRVLLLCGLPALVLAGLGFPLPPLFSRVGTVISLEESLRNVGLWWPADGLLQYDFSSWVWGAVSWVLLSSALLAHRATQVARLLRRAPVRARITLPLFVTLPAVAIYCLPPLLLDALALPQSSYADRRWLDEGAVVNAAIISVPYMIVFVAYALDVPRIARESERLRVRGAGAKHRGDSRRAVRKSLVRDRSDEER